MDLIQWIKQQWDRALAIGLVGLGALALALGAAGVSRSELATQQIPYAVSGGLAGLFLLGLGSTLWLSADLRDEWRVLDELRDALDASNHAGDTTEHVIGESTLERDAS